jgi:formylglycine-generating enzyme
MLFWFRNVVLAVLIGITITARAADTAAARPGMAYVPAGEFLMGSKAGDPNVFEHEAGSEQPQHPVKLKAFYIDRTEVTHKQFDSFQPGHPRDERSPCDDCPMTNVSWHDAKAYCESQKKRLPTEAEWEKAAKGGKDETFAPLDDYAWYNANAIKGTKPVGQKKPNGYGIYDMLGNVREWTNDWFDVGYYQKSPKEDPKGPDKGERKVERGGAFFLPKRSVTTTIRYNHPPTFRLYFLGFRCAQDA